MTRHHFQPTQYSNVIGTLPAVIEIASGDSVVTTTLDAAGTDHDGAQKAPRGNPMTGPFFVTGAEPGDALLVTIERMTPNRDTGWTYSPLAPGVLDPATLADLPKRERYEWTIDAKAGTVKLLDPSPRIRDWSFPLKPMLGCFGVAPERGQSISTATSGAHGGNMDYRLFGPGATIAFPVHAPGGLFFLTVPHRKSHMMVVTPRQRLSMWRFPVGLTSLSEAYHRFVRRRIWIDPHHCWEIGDGSVERRHVEGALVRQGLAFVQFMELPYCDYWVLRKTAGGEP